MPNAQILERVGAWMQNKNTAGMTNILNAEWQEWQTVGDFVISSGAHQCDIHSLL